MTSDSPRAQHTSVVVVGAGPAGLTVGNILRAASVGCVVLESESRAAIERRPRAGVIEEWAVRGLRQRGLAHGLMERGQRHSACEFRFGGERHRLSYTELTGHHHWVYPQPLLVADLVREYVDVRGGDARFSVRDVELHDLDSARPSVSYTCPESGERHLLTCDFVVGADGARGVSRAAIPAGHARIARHDYGVGWLALLAEAPPSSDCVLFGVHPNGFAGHMARSPEVTRYYLQCPPGDDPGNWSHDRVWSELHRRLEAAGAPPLTEGPLIEKRILALHDAFLLGDALVAAVDMGDGDGLDGYSRACLRRVWDYQEFSQWLSEVYHGTAAGDPFRAGASFARLRRLFTSPAAAAAFAEQYLGTAERY
ncbi:FAD-dependent monooxygenase [Streptomyces sp. ID05-04B]|uniref:FAD-dependent monooxygenase n=1 Tax=Streptomyces sp. ID05-04B TaxID=3028661 RepID=UPI0029C53BC9|nr:FAD-dependent monooxygenase [Streptomyces sp. ID05-04B]MDX5562571.1 FAD-dependent monooxygenase [Streptomyces sp. ID05-04B]